MARRPNHICIHEAAHAVIGHCLGYTVTRLWWNQKPGPKCRGWTYALLKVKLRKPDPVVDCCMTMAGHLAEVLWCGQKPQMWPEGDFRHLERQGIDWRGRNILKPMVKRWLRQERPYIMAVARSLESRGCLTRRQFLAVLREEGKRRGDV